MNGDFKKLVFLDVKARVELWVKLNRNEVPIGRCCLKWAHETVLALHALGVRAGINAGTAQWRVCEDDGVNPDFFGYVFEWNREGELLVRDGLMPEMHCWCVIREQDSPTGEAQIIDFSVGFQAANAASTGATVDRELPPFVWFGVRNGPPIDCRYDPSEMATKIAYHFLSLGG